LLLPNVGYAEQVRPVHKGPWPIRNGHNYQPAENELRSSHLQDVTPDQAREVDRLYSELLATHPATKKNWSSGGKGDQRMRSIWQRSRMIAIVVVIVLGAGAIALARPHPISEPVLGTEWQCSRAAFVVTCNHRWDGAPDPDTGLNQPTPAPMTTGVAPSRNRAELPIPFA